MKRPRVMGALLISLLMLGPVLWLSTRAGDAKEALPEKETTKRTPVVSVPVSMTVFQDLALLAGNVEAKETALVSARMPGVLDAIYVDEGDVVQANQTKLFQTDSLKLTKAVEIAQRQVEVARCAVRERKANLERVQADLAKATLDYERFKRLYEEDHAIPLHAYELQESRFHQLSAAAHQAEEALMLSGKQAEQAESSLTMAEKDLADSLVLAPIHGVIVERKMEPGELAGPGAPVLRMEDPSAVEISCFLPAKCYGFIQPGETVMSCSFRGERWKEEISYISPVIDPNLRTFEVKSETSTPPPWMIPGAMVQIEIVLSQRKGLAVPSEAVQTRNNTKVVFKAEGDRAISVPVKTGLTTGNMVEIVEGALTEGDDVIIQGQFLLEDGDAIQKGAEK